MPTGLCTHQSWTPAASLSFRAGCCCTACTPICLRRVRTPALRGSFFLPWSLLPQTFLALSLLQFRPDMRSSETSPPIQRHGYSLARVFAAACAMSPPPPASALPPTAPASDPHPRSPATSAGAEARRVGLRRPSRRRRPEGGRGARRCSRLWSAAGSTFGQPRRRRLKTSTGGLPPPRPHAPRSPSLEEATRKSSS